MAHCAKLRADFPFQYTPAPEGKLKTQSAIEAIYNGLKPTEDNLVVSTGVGNHQVRTRANRLQSYTLGLYMCI